MAGQEAPTSVGLLASARCALKPINGRRTRPHIAAGDDLTDRDRSGTDHLFGGVRKGAERLISGRYPDSDPALPGSAWREEMTWLVLWAFSLWAFDRQSPSAFYTEARLVVVHATVRDDRGTPVTHLDQRAFIVYENRRPQPVSLFLGENVPVSLGIVIDNSGSMRMRRSKVEAAAIALVRASDRSDDVFVVNFADRPQIDVPITNVISVLEAGISRLDSIGGTALWDAVERATQYLNEHARRDRKVLLLITVFEVADDEGGAVRALAERPKRVFPTGFEREPGI